MEKNRAGEREWGFFGGSGAGRKSCTHGALCDVCAIHVDFAFDMAVKRHRRRDMVLA